MDRAANIELAARRRQEPELLDTDQYVIVDVQDTPYAIPLMTVVEVEQLPPIALVPQTRPWVRGVVNLRGNILTLVDLAGLLDLGVWRETGAARMLVIDRDDPVAVAVDRLRGMRRLTNRMDNAIVDHLPGEVGRYCLGLYREEGEYIAALDIPAILRDVEAQRGGTVGAGPHSASAHQFHASDGRL